MDGFGARKQGLHDTEKQMKSGGKKLALYLLEVATVFGYPLVSQIRIAHFVIRSIFGRMMTGCLQDTTKHRCPDREMDATTVVVGLL